MYPHERSLVKRLAGKPFALLGVNTDEDRAELKKVLDKKNLSWRNWWDGGSIDGSIATKWQIDNWPTIYVLDARGFIRHIDAGGPDADFKAVGKIVDTLIQELAAKQR